MAKKTVEDQLKDLDLSIEEKAKRREKLIDELAVKKAQAIRLKEKKDAIEAAKNKKLARKTEDARKIILGAFIEKQLKDEGATPGKINFLLQSKLPGFLTRQRDRDLFPEFSFVEKTDGQDLV